jgi:hypothetical protein
MAAQIVGRSLSHPLSVPDVLCTPCLRVERLLLAGTHLKSFYGKNEGADCTPSLRRDFAVGHCSVIAEAPYRAQP